MTLSPPGEEVAHAARTLRWPGLATPRPAPVRAWLAERLFRGTIRDLAVRAVLPGGEVLGAGGSGSPFAAHITTLVPRSLQGLRRWVDTARPDDERNTVAGARDNIHRHYDLSNQMFEAFLDGSMTYSSALFAPDSDDLHAAQLRKIDSVLDLADVTAGTHLLEIGTGWGALAIRAARRGARVTTLTISAERRIAEAGLADRMLATRRSYTWIHKYVFPGGQLLSVPAVHTGADTAGLRVTARPVSVRATSTCGSSA